MRPAVALIALLPTFAFAQVDAVVHSDPSRGITLPPAGTAWAEGSTAPTYNPAGLTHTGMFEVFYAHERSLARGVGVVGDGLYFATNPFDFIGAGLSIEWLRSDGVSDFRKTNFSLAFGGDGLSAGIGFNWFGNGTIANAFSVDLGLQTRFSRYVSLGASIKNVDQPTYNGVVLPRRFQVGAGIRPFREHLTFGIDWILDEQAGPAGSRLAYSLDAKIVSGLHIFAGASHGFNGTTPLSVQLGLRLDTSHFGIGYTVGGASQAPGLSHLAYARITADKAPALPIRDGVIALIDMNSLGDTQGTGTVGTLLNVTPADRYVRTAALLERAVTDRRLRGIVLKVELSSLGMGRAQELRNAVLKLRAAGKTVVALVFSCADQDYVVASAADHLYSVPEAMLTIDGLRSNVLFFGGTAEKLGVRFDVARSGKYKNSPDQFTRSDMSPEQREAIDAYLDTDARVLEQAVIQSRKLTPQQWQSAVAEGLKTPKRAKELNLIDDVLTPNELEERLPDLIPGGQLVGDYRPVDTREERWGFKSRIAVIPVIGTISGGKDSGDPIGIGLLQSAGADTFIRAIDSAAGDPQVAAIVVRVDSPGGDGLASDLMYRAVLQAKKRKPVIASMGDVAASGGYYAAMGADLIFASEGTITGSIGVFYLKPSVKDLAEKLGVNQVAINRGELAGVTDYYDPWTEPQRAAAQKWIDAFYDNFITEAAASRKKTKEELHTLAQGRVWSGADARANGLVDELGGLAEALEAARERSGSQWRDLDIVVYGGSGGLLGSIFGSSAYGRAVMDVEVERPKPTAIQRLAQTLGLELWMMEAGAKAHLGFSLHLD